MYALAMLGQGICDVGVRMIEAMIERQATGIKTELAWVLNQRALLEAVSQALGLPLQSGITRRCGTRSVKAVWREQFEYGGTGCIEA